MKHGIRSPLLRALLAAMVVLGALLALAPGARAQDDPGDGGDEIEYSLRGTVRAGGLIEGVRFVVSLDGEVVGETTTDAEGRWEILLDGPGVYQVEIDVTTLPEGITLRDGTEAITDRAVENGPTGVIFALDGRVDGNGSVDDPAAEENSVIAAAAEDSTLERYLNRLASGIRVGSLVALAAIGLSLIYGVTSLVNFAHAEMVGFGAVVAWTFEDITGMPMILAGLIGVIFGAMLGFVLERGLFAPLRARKLSLISLMVVSIGLAFVLRYAYLIYFGSARRFFRDYRSQSNYDVGPFSLPPKDYLIIGVSIVVLILVGLLLQRTKLGTAMRAVADNRDLAESSGIDVKRTILAVWVSGSALAALAGVFIGVTQNISWQMGERQLLLIFAAVTLGGLGTAYGAMVGGMAIGIASEMSTLWLDNDLKFLVALTVLIVILVVRPQGLLGQRERFG